jgi:hypothetical protein
MCWDTNQDSGVVALTSYVSDYAVLKPWTALSQCDNAVCPSSNIDWRSLNLPGVQADSDAPTSTSLFALH